MNWNQSTAPTVRFSEQGWGQSNTMQRMSDPNVKDCTQQADSWSFCSPLIVPVHQTTFRGAATIIHTTCMLPIWLQKEGT